MATKLMIFIFLASGGLSVFANTLSEKILNAKAKEPNRKELIKLAELVAYLPAGDRVGYQTGSNFKDRLAVMESVDLELASDLHQFVLLFTQAYVSEGATAPPNQAVVSHPDLIPDLRLLGRDAVYPSSPAYNALTPDGKGTLESNARDRQTGKPVRVNYELKTVGQLTVRGVTYSKVRKISYDEPEASLALSQMPIPTTRLVKSRVTEYFAPNMGIIRREDHREHFDVTANGTKKVSDDAFFIEYELIKSGSPNARLFGSQLARIAATNRQFAALYFLKILPMQPRFQDLSPTQIEAARVLIELALAQTREKFSTLQKDAAFNNYLKSKGYRAKQIKELFESVIAFSHP